MILPYCFNAQFLNLSNILCVALYLLYSARPYQCASSGNSCSLTPTTLSSHIGYPALTECTVAQGNAFACSVLCNASPTCKAVFVMSCDQSGQCTCSYCNKLTLVDFKITNTQFFLHTQEIGKNTNHVTLTNQLTAGQPLLAEIFIKGTRVILTFYTTVGHKAFRTEIRFDEWSVVSNSYIGYTWGQEDRYTPHFNFHQGQTISMFCVVTSTAYHLYFDRVLFKNFGHRFSIDRVSAFTVADESNGESYIKWFRR